MQLTCLAQTFSVCKIKEASQIDLSQPYCFVGKTDRELSLVCETGRAPSDCLCREDGWRGLRVEGTLDFSLVGILAQLSGILARNQISLFAVSTYDTDYLFIKEKSWEKALRALEEGGYLISSSIEQ